MSKATIAVVVPAYNEEQVIQSSLKSLARVISAQHIYVVSDGSTDQTAKLAKQTVPQVLALRKNRGKAGALEALIRKYQLTKRYRYVFFFDADTRIRPSFITEIKKVIKAQRPALVVGTVTSDRNKLISAYRVYEYGFSHMFFKNAQNVMGTIVVAPGCASIYRADVLDQLDFSRKTLTEDLDLTMQIHKNKLGKIVYCPKAKVITQDPTTFADYWKQINRWNTGWWQNFFIHKLYQPNSKINAEVLLLLADLLLWLYILSLAIIHPLIFIKLYALAFALASGLGLLVSLITANYWALPYVPLFGFFQLINLTSLIYSFFRAIFGRSSQLGWQKVSRYSVS